MAVLLALAPSLARAGRPLVTTYTSADFHTAAPLWRMKQGPDGTLYIGANGLLTFDGDRWSASDIPGLYYVRGLDLGPDGRLWAGGVNDIGYFYRGPSGIWSYRSLVSELPAKARKFGECWYCYSLGAGAVFVTQGAVLFWDGTTFQVKDMPDRRRLAAVRVGGTIFIHHRSTGLYRVEKGGKLILIIPAAKLPEGLIIWVDPSPEGLTLVTSTGLYFWDGSRLAPRAPETSVFLRENIVSCGHGLPGGRLAVGTLKGGILILGSDGRVLQHFAAPDTLPTNEIFSLFRDKEGGLWATSSGPLCRIAIDAPVSQFDARDGLSSSEPIKSLAEVSGQVWAASENHIYRLTAAGRFERSALYGQTIYSLAGAPDGLLVARYEGIDLLDGRTKALDSWPTYDDIFIAAPSARKGLIYAAGGEHLYVFRPGRRQPVQPPLKLPDNPMSLAEDAEGNLWVSTATAGVIVAHQTATGLRNPVDIDWPGLSDHCSVIRTPGGGICLFGGRKAWYRPPQGRGFVPVADFPGRTVAAAADDGRAVWVLFAQDGDAPPFLGSIRFDRGLARYSPQAVDGLWSIGIPTSLYASAGAGRTTVWIMGSLGLLRAELLAGEPAPRPPPPQIALLVETQPGRPTLALRGPVRYPVSKILAYLSVPSYARRPALRAQMRIDGIDRDWVTVAGASPRELIALHDGRFVIHLRTLADTGMVGAADDATITILPPLWRTWQAFVVYFIVVAVAGYGAYRYRVRSLRERNLALEAMVAKRTEQAEAANAAKTEFVARVSHDIRNPLTGIAGLTLALQDSGLSHRQEEIVAALEACTHYLTRLVDDVLDFSKIEAGKIDLHPGPASPKGVLESIARILQAEAAEAGASFEIEVDRSLPELILVDIGRLEEILLNFATNAVRYAGGRIRLMAKRAEDMVQFAVEDRGAGFTEEEQARLFTKFTRLADAADTPVKGSGLGLAVCRKLADLMGGSVDVTSSRGNGARFFVDLPLVAAEETAAGPDESFAFDRVLLVEDSEYNVWAIEAVLKRLGIAAPTTARTGAEALQLAGAAEFDLILLDRNLPDLDGLEVARRLRRLEKPGRRALIISISALSTTEDREACLHAGMDSFLGKPLTPEKLRRALLEVGIGPLPAPSISLAPPLSAPVGNLNIGLLVYLKGEGGAEAQVLRYCHMLRQELAKLAEAVASQARPSVAFVAHSILTLARMVEADGLAKAATAAQAAARGEGAFEALAGKVLSEGEKVIEVLSQGNYARPSA